MKDVPVIKRRILIAIIGILVLAGMCLLFRFHKQNEVKKDFLQKLSAETYDSIFLAQYTLENYSVEDFETFRGVSPIIATYEMKELSEISNCLKAAFESDNVIEHVYLGLDPEVMWKNSGENTEEWLMAVGQELCTIFVKYPDVTFEILLYYPELSHWTQMSVDELNIYTKNIEKLTIALESFGNIRIYFPGMEEWLIANPSNYEDTYEVTPEIAGALMRLAFCDQRNQVNVENVQDTLLAFTQYILSQKSEPTGYSDLSDWNIVFFGDSIMGNYDGSLSIPGVVKGLSGAHVYNYGVGGTPAGDFAQRIDDFMNQSIGESRDEELFPYDKVENDADMLCFVIHYGLNDYFSGAPVDNPEEEYDTNTYAGCLRSGTRKLQECYPNAKIILMPPPFTITFTNGTEIKSAEGGVLTDYVDVAISVAKEMGVECLESYYTLNMNEDNEHIYLADGCHYNEYGRFLTGSRIVRALEENIN